MCVIIIKPKGKKVPPKSILKKCWDGNSHGAGYAINRKGKTEATVQKGFMDFDAFYKALVEEDVHKRDILIMHFRLATHGYRIAEHTHPFPISTDKKELELLAYTSNMVCAHNGIFNLAAQPKDVSDTMYYIQGWLSQHNLSLLEENDKDTMEAIDKQIGWSKVAILINGSVHMFGKFERFQGCWYSNTHSVKPISYATGYWNTDGEYEWSDYYKKRKNDKVPHARQHNHTPKDILSDTCTGGLDIEY
jgi:predicted glutamine amidotransferase